MGGPKRILVVDDEVQNRDLLEALLESMGCKPQMAEDGFQALDMLCPEIDLVLLDVMLPGIDGFEVARRMRGHPECPDVPIIMVTALTSKEDRLIAVQAGANDFVTKPIDKVELKVRMASLLKMKEATDSIKRHRAELEVMVEQRTAALRESEERMRLLIEASPIGIMIVQHGILSYVNPALVRMLGYESADEIVGLDRKALFAAHERDRFDSWADEALSGHGSVLGREIMGLGKSGDTPDLSLWLAFTNFRDQPALLGFVIDVSEQKALKAQLVQAQKLEALGTLAGGIAHDFNNILFVIMGYCELAMDDLDDESRSYQDLQRVIEAVSRAKYMVQQILTFSRQTQQEKKAIEITPIVKETLKFLRGSIPATIDIQNHIHRDPGTIMADPTQIHQVLMNLCTNAAHSMRSKGGVLTVELEPAVLEHDMALRMGDIDPGLFLRLSVIDTGVGMTPEVMRRIFEPYFTTKDRGEGTGLGLSVVHGIVKSHAGAITVRSAPNNGSRFDAYFPVVRLQTAEEPTDTDEPTAGTETILLVDDEENVSNIGKRALEKLGYKVIISKTGTEALEIFQAGADKFDVVITDMTMPRLTGGELAARVKKIRADIPIILCTGFSDSDTEAQMAEGNVDALVFKPVSSRKMASTIRSVMERFNERKC